MNNNKNNKIIVILGPTSSGKSSLAIKLSKEFKGEIISADSRQVYRSLDIGTGKIEGYVNSKNKQFISENIPHYFIDIVSPRTEYNVSKFKKKAEKIIEDILSRNKLPIICGGTGFWIKSLVDNVDFPQVKPNSKLRQKLNKKTASQLFKKLQKTDPRRAQNIDPQNKVRLIRALEIAEILGEIPTSSNNKPKYNFLQIGINLPKEKLEKNIKKRLNQRWQAGMIEEIKKIKKNYKLSFPKIQSFGLAYYWIPLYLKNKINKKELYEKVYLAEKNYTKRQMTWFKRDKRIKWLRDYREIRKMIREFM